MVRWNTIQQATMTGQIDGIRQNSIQPLWNAINQAHGLAAYNMQGEQQARTTVTWNGTQTRYTTNHQMHSEMVACQDMLANRHWVLDGDGRVVDGHGNRIQGGAFQTNAPHCGYCTIMLHLLGLPIGTATQGRFNGAVNLNYPVPEAVKNEPRFLGRLVDGDGAVGQGLLHLKNLIDPYIRPNAWSLQVGPNEYVIDGQGLVQNPQNPPTPVGWHDDVATHSLTVPGQHYGQLSGRDFFWKMAFEAIFDTV